VYLEFSGIWSCGLPHAYQICCLGLSYVQSEQTMNPKKNFYCDLIFVIICLSETRQQPEKCCTGIHELVWKAQQFHVLPHIPLHPILSFCFLFHNAEKARTVWILNNSIQEHLQEFEMAVWSIHIKAPCYLLLLRFQTERFLFLRRFEEWLICVNTSICMRTRLFLYKHELSLFLCLKGYTNPISELEEYPVT